MHVSLFYIYSCMIGFMQLMNLCSFLIKTLKKEHIELISFDSSGEREREGCILLC